MNILAKKQFFERIMDTIEQKEQQAKKTCPSKESMFISGLLLHLLQYCKAAVPP